MFNEYLIQIVRATLKTSMMLGVIFFIKICSQLVLNQQKRTNQRNIYLKTTKQNFYKSYFNRHLGEILQ